METRNIEKDRERTAKRWIDENLDRQKSRMKENYNQVDRSIERTPEIQEHIDRQKEWWIDREIKKKKLQKERKIEK